MRRHFSTRQSDESGLALIVVMVVLLLAMLLVIGAARSAWFSEHLTGIDADHERAFANAQALLADAEYDIRATSPDGRPCLQSATSVPWNCREPAGSEVSGAPWIPRQGQRDFMRLRALLTVQAGSTGFACAQGVCLPDALPRDFWQLPTVDLARIEGAGARYAQFSGAPAAPADNPLLSNRAWYWIEILPYAGPFGSPEAPDADNPFIFRITALAMGHHPATRVALQRLFVWKRLDS